MAAGQEGRRRDHNRQSAEAYGGSRQKNESQRGQHQGRSSSNRDRTMQVTKESTRVTRSSDGRLLVATRNSEAGTGKGGVEMRASSRIQVARDGSGKVQSGDIDIRVTDKNGKTIRHDRYSLSPRRDGSVELKDVNGGTDRGGRGQFAAREANEMLRREGIKVDYGIPDRAPRSDSIEFRGMRPVTTKEPSQNRTAREPRPRPEKAPPDQSPGPRAEARPQQPFEPRPTATRPERSGRPERDRPERPQPGRGSGDQPPPNADRPTQPAPSGRGNASGSSWSLFLFGAYGRHMGKGVELGAEGIWIAGIDADGPFFSFIGATGFSVGPYAHYEGKETSTHGPDRGISLDEFSFDIGEPDLIELGAGGGKWQEHTGNPMATGPYGFFSAGVLSHEASIGMGGSADWIGRANIAVTEWHYDKLSNLIGEEKFARIVLGIEEQYERLMEELRVKKDPDSKP